MTAKSIISILLVLFILGGLAFLYLRNKRRK
jgi:LPXTG-motif cell wall-anchored protein